ncbi:hypothetical protein [Herbidospora daliensis]|uniref:hypothetical protein n=1 Tax=Herbidospora daliensis TaxID=295585 RepID=UPI000780F43F|nr:hypothetical protein [Herbidospora daliensis]
MSLFTPADAASVLTAHNGTYSFDDDNERVALPEVTWVEDLPVVEIRMIPVRDAVRPDRKASEHFEAHVFAVEKPGPVATEPVTLPVYVARELAQREPNPDVSVNGWTVVANSEGEARRDMRWWHLVIRDEAGRHFRASYLVDPDGLGPKPFEDDEPVFTPVERHTRVVQVEEWWVVIPPADGPSDLDAPEATDG